jgi:peptide/nickel transport system substrate-binding protein
MSIYDQLVRVDTSGTTLEPALAEKWEISPDGLTYTFHLRKDVLFSDGTPLKASDVKFSIDRAKTNKKSGWTFTGPSSRVRGATATASNGLISSGV